MVERKIIYFDNAATSYPKPEVVYRTHDACLRKAGNPGRGAHRLALESARTVFEGRNKIASFLGIKSPERLAFTPGCTYSINAVLRGYPFLEQGRSPDHPPVVIVSPLEHNAVMRPLHRLERAGIVQIHCLKYAPVGVVDLIELKEAIRGFKPVLCAIQEGSNVTGELVDIVAVWEICRAAKVSLLIDAAQTAGLTSSRLPELIDTDDTADGGGGLFWCSSGHKGLLGPAGIGLLFVAESADIEPLVAGGTGSNSENLEMPTDYPDRLESGTLPVQIIGALAAAVSWLGEEGIAKIRKHESDLTNRFLTFCREQPYIKVFGNRVPQEVQDDSNHLFKAGLPVVSFAIDGVPSDRVADLLDREFGIAVRSGLHCAMAAHQSLGTLKNGLTRASFGYFNTADEVDELCRALTMIYKKRDF